MCSRQVHFKVWFLFLSIGQNTTVFSLVVSCFWMFRKSRISRASEQQRALLVDIERTDPRGWNLKVCVVFQQGRWHCELWTVGICIAQQSSWQHCGNVATFRISCYSSKCMAVSRAASLHCSCRLFWAVFRTFIFLFVWKIWACPWWQNIFKYVPPLYLHFVRFALSKELQKPKYGRSSSEAEKPIIIFGTAVLSRQTGVHLLYCRVD